MLVALDKCVLGFKTRDAKLNQVAQILHLLHIKELQTKINEASVAIIVYLRTNISWQGGPMKRKD